MREAPRFQRAVVLSFVIGECGVNRIEPLLRHLNRLHDGQRIPRAITHDHPLVDLSQHAVRGSPAGRRLPPCQHQAREFIGQLRAVAEIEPLQAGH